MVLISSIGDQKSDNITTSESGDGVKACGRLARSNRSPASIRSRRRARPPPPLPRASPSGGSGLPAKATAPAPRVLGEDDIAMMQLVADPRWGEAACAAVVLKPGSVLIEPDVHGWLATGEVPSSRTARIWVSPERARWAREERRVAQDRRVAVLLERRRDAEDDQRQHHEGCPDHARDPEALQPGDERIERVGHDDTEEQRDEKLLGRVEHKERGGRSDEDPRQAAPVQRWDRIGGGGPCRGWSGIRQYNRTAVVEGGFKAALYAPRANHGQFNTVWGAGDQWAQSYAAPVPAAVHGKRRVFVFAGGESTPPTGGLLCIDPADGTVDFTFPWRGRRRESVNASSPLLIGGDRIPISRNLRDGVIQQILGNRLFRR